MGSAIAQPLQQILDELHSRYVSLRDGDVADYIPQLAKMNPDEFGIAVATLDGHVYTVGDCDVPFTIQSISKPFVYGLALEDHGFEHVLGRVGVEPTGDAFNAISLDPLTGRPANPMINAGAIATTCLVKDEDDGAMGRIMAMFERFAGRELCIDESVYKSEYETGHRNRAIGYMLRNFNIVTESPDRGLDLYFRQCSISVTCRDLAIMAATLANRGTNPLTDERALDPQYVDSVLSVMGSCGMYNYAGEWIYRVGIPAKSGVSGGVLACLPGQLGIGVYSPRLDGHGNSVRGVNVCNDLSATYSLHIHNVPNVTRACLRSRYTALEVHSKRRRPQSETEILAAEGHRACTYELQGHLNFASVESFSRQVVEDARECDFFTIDFLRALRIDPGGTVILGDLIRDLLAAGKYIAVSDSEHVRGLDELMQRLADSSPALHLADNRDRALEWSEDRLIEAVHPVALDAEEIPLADNEFFAGIDPETVTQLIELCEPVEASAGTTLIESGAPVTSLFFLTQGEVSVTIDLPFLEHVRLATYSAGMTFGHRCVLETGPQESATTADSDVRGYLLKAAHLERVAQSDPSLMAAIYRTVARNLARQVDEVTAEVRALSI